jgi:hypothetical protein
MGRKTPESEILGAKYGQLTVIEFAGIHGEGTKAKRVYKCKCECGIEVNVWLMSLRNGGTKSCGCYNKPYKSLAVKKYGIYHNHLRHVYTGMISRCYNENNIGYHNYGKRSIFVCEEWRNDWFVFYCWAIDNGWRKGLQIDRKDNNGIYSPENCRIVTVAVNSRNKRDNRNITYNGITMCLRDWSIKIGVSEAAIRERLNAGRELKEALTCSKWKKVKLENVAVVPVRQLSLEGYLINEFKSISDAGRLTGVDASAIAKVVKGKFKKAGNFYWEKAC